MDCPHEDLQGSEQPGEAVYWPLLLLLLFPPWVLRPSGQTGAGNRRLLAGKDILGTAGGPAAAVTPTRCHVSPGRGE